MGAFKVIIWISFTVSVYTQKLTCPPTLPVEMCDARCGPEVPCENNQVCCPTECGGAMCVAPVTERHFVSQEKPGRCPEVPRGPWVCSDTCTGDSDCRRALKCCGNRCGARACQLPDQGDSPPPPPPEEDARV